MPDVAVDWRKVPITPSNPLPLPLSSPLSFSLFPLSQPTSRANPLPRQICHECFGQRVQTAVVAFRDQGQECLDISDEESENLAPQFPSNWTIDVSTRTTIGGMRMEERKVSSRCQTLIIPKFKPLHWMWFGLFVAGACCFLMF
jgi:hypothetical protein